MPINRNRGIDVSKIVTVKTRAWFRRGLRKAKNAPKKSGLNKNRLPPFVHGTCSIVQLTLVFPMRLGDWVRVEVTQFPPRLGYDQFGGAAVVNVDCAAAYQPHIVPLFDREPVGDVSAALPIVASSAMVGKSLLTTALMAWVFLLLPLWTTNESQPFLYQVGSILSPLGDIILFVDEMRLVTLLGQISGCPHARNASPDNSDVYLSQGLFPIPFTLFPDDQGA